MANRTKEAPRTNSKEKAAPRAQLSQADVPAYTLEDALRIPKAIGDNYGYKPTAPLEIAAAMNMTPNSGPFRMLTGAAIAYGLTDGGAFAPQVSITPLGMRIVRVTAEGDDVAAKREALLKPRIVGEFLRKYDKAPIPREDIGMNVLQTMGVPQERAKAVFALIVGGADSVGLVRQIKDKRYITLDGVPAAEQAAPAGAPAGAAEPITDITDENDEPALPATPAAPAVGTKQAEVDRAQKRVYVTHGKNRALLDSIKKLLSFGDLEPVISVERQSVSQPVTEKIMSDMRSCGAAIIHVDAEEKLMDKEAKEHIVLNDNVVMEIGAALALYGRRYVLLVGPGVTLPTNLQGLFEVRYTGATLDGEATVRLLEAIRDIKNHPMPARY